MMQDDATPDLNGIPCFESNGFSRASMGLRGSLQTTLQTFGQDKIVPLHLRDRWVPIIGSLQRSIPPCLHANGSGKPSAVLQGTLSPLLEGQQRSSCSISVPEMVGVFSIDLRFAWIAWHHFVLQDHKTAVGIPLFHLTRLVAAMRYGPSHPIIGRTLVRDLPPFLKRPATPL